MLGMDGTQVGVAESMTAHVPIIGHAVRRPRAMPGPFTEAAGTRTHRPAFAQ